MMEETTKNEIESLFDKPITSWPQSLQVTYWAMPSWVRGDLQTVADLIEVWIKNDRREMSEDEVFPNQRRIQK